VPDCKIDEPDVEIYSVLMGKAQLFIQPFHSIAASLYYEHMVVALRAEANQDELWYKHVCDTYSAYISILSKAEVVQSHDYTVL
jgi:hypothetical protein